MIITRYIRRLGLIMLALCSIQSDMFAWRDRHGDDHGAGDIIAPTFLGTAIGGIAGGGKGALIGGGIGLGTGLITHETRKGRDRRKARAEGRSCSRTRSCRSCGEYHEELDTIDQDEYIRQLEQENDQLRRVKQRRYRAR